MLKFKDYLADWPDVNYQNFIEWLDAGEKRFSNNPAIFYRSGKQRDFTVWSYTKYAGECRRIARGLLAAGLGKGDRVVLWAENRPEWMAVWMGAAIAGLVIVPVDFLVPEKECLNIIKMTKAGAFFYSGRKQSFVDSFEAENLRLAVKVCISKADGSGGEEDTPFYSFGRENENQALPGASSIAGRDPVSIVFTSGTTGFAKGVTLCHRGIIANVNGAILSLRAYEWDRFINVLPLHHTYPTTCSFIAPLTLGAGTIIVEKLVGKVVVDDIHDAKGTFLIAVPLLYDKVMVALNQGFQELPFLLRAVFNLLRKISLAEAHRGRIGFGRAMLYIIRKKAKLSSIRIMVAGGGALNPKTADFFDSFGFNMVHGYGMSENSPLISVNTPWHRRNESVGLPVKDTFVKIIEADEEGRGEIAVMSPSLMLGYFENPEATTEMFDEDGCLKTGDLGYLDSDGFIYINGRKKNLIVSSGGKNIYPEEIEKYFSSSRVIGEILVVGRKEKDFGGEQIVAVTVPNFETLAGDYPGREHDEEFVKKLIKNEIENINRSLPGYKKITDFILRTEPFEKNAQQKILRFLYKNYENP
ncbi:MAG: AMP-binding protein [Treponema sp.]|jgi:long-chain acyl-CoA synthetase|nr:AMP-binding protein [Treponema sp.]